MYLEPRSLVLISGKAYDLLHGISERTFDSFNDIEMNIFNKPKNLKTEKIQRSTRFFKTNCVVKKIIIKYF